LRFRINLCRTLSALLLLPTLSLPSSTFAQRATKRSRVKGAPAAAAVTTVNPGDVLISELRFSGANGAQDEFIELYNNTDADIVVASSDNSAGWRLASSEGSLDFTIPNGDVIPARGHYLVVNADGYSLGGYPTGTPGTGGATGDRSYTGDVPDTNVGIVLLRGANSFTLEDRLDAVGPTGETEAFYKEGNGLPAISGGAGNDYSFYRNLSTGRPVDTDENEADFILVSTSLDLSDARLGAPAPENTGSPIERNATIKPSLVDPQCSGGGAATSACARVRSGAGANPANAAFGTLAIRRKFTNTTTASVTRLRFRVVNITTAPEAGTADLRVIGGSGNFSANTAAGGNTTIERLTLEQPPVQASGGGFNSTLSANTITLRQPLSPGAFINVEFLLGVQQDGSYRFFVNVEALP
jgi:hypothetical protein